MKVVVGWFLIVKDNLWKIVIQKRERDEKMMNFGIFEEKIKQNENMRSEDRLKKFRLVKNILYFNVDIFDRVEREFIVYEQR